MTKPLVEPRTDTIWVGNFSKLKPADFGMPDFHGRFHPEIVAQAILRYHPRFVLDPMAGGGTTIDVCRMLKTAYIAYDIDPRRPEINEGEVWRLEPGHLPAKADMLVLHPPYWDAIQYGSPMDQAATVEEFARLFGLVVDGCLPHLTTGAHAVLVIGNVYKDKQQVPLDMYCMREMMELGFVIRGRVCKDFGETKGGAKRGQALFDHRALKNGYWRFSWEQVFFLQWRP